jgi:hypothetical protein
MKTKSQSLLSWFRGSFYFGAAFSLLIIGAMIYEIIHNGNWNVESLNGQLSMGLMFIYFSGKPMVDERIRFLKFKGLTMSFVITLIVLNVFNYLYTYPDGLQENAISSYWFALICMIVAFLSFYILKSSE